MKLSLAVTVCNEYDEIQRLIPFLIENKRKQDEVVVLFDQKNGDQRVADYLRTFSKLPNFQFWRGHFDDNFAEWKNKLTDYCKGDYIFQIDADEMPHKSLLTNIPAIIESNDTNEVYWVPRINTVEGLTEDDINNWHWKVNDKGWVNFPDPQMRIYKKSSDIIWKNKVHERLEGYNTYAMLPQSEAYCLYHPKDIKRQRKQNDYYDTLQP